MQELARIAEMLVRCLNEELALTKVCGACGSNNRLSDIECPMCDGDMEVHTIEVSHKMWMCPWCDHPYFPYEEEAMKAKYCRSCYIRWDVVLEKRKKIVALREIVISARQHGRT